MIQFLNAVWEKDYGDPSRKLVMLCLADMANKEGFCWPSVQTIGRKCSLSVRSVQRHLQALQSVGAITITPKFKDGKSTSNDYRIVANRGVVDDMGRVSPASPRTTIESCGALQDPKSMLTRPTQLPLSLRGKSRE